MGKTLLLLGWTLIRVEFIKEIFKEIEKIKTKKELESSLVILKSKFK